MGLFDKLKAAADKVKNSTEDFLKKQMGEEAYQDMKDEAKSVANDVVDTTKKAASVVASTAKDLYKGAVDLTNETLKQIDEQEKSAQTPDADTTLPNKGDAAKDLNDAAGKKLRVKKDGKQAPKKDDPDAGVSL